MSVTGHFLTPLRLEDTGDGDHFILLEPLEYVSKAGVHYVAPAGFVTDLNSVPWFFRRTFPKSSRANRASVLHDYHYAHGAPPKALTDALYNEGMEADHVNGFQRRVQYAAVKYFGQTAWDNHAKERQQKAEAA